MSWNIFVLTKRYNKLFANYQWQMRAKNTKSAIKTYLRMLAISDQIGELSRTKKPV